MKICPNCGKLVSYNSYFGAYICDNCNWEKSERVKRYVVGVERKGVGTQRAIGQLRKASTAKASYR